MRAQQRRETIKPLLEIAFRCLCQRYIEGKARLGEESIVAEALRNPGERFQELN